MAGLPVPLCVLKSWYTRKWSIANICSSSELVKEGTRVIDKVH